VASVAGVRAGPNAAQYIASKWGMVGLTKALAVEFGPQGVIVNAVAPATIPETAIGQSSLEQKIEMGWGTDIPETIANQAKNYPLRRLGTADDVARGIRYLLSEDAAWMTGQVLSMDGGATAS
jgi:NAD(P)-dependent dehydrogenase (short-subunit alcohol dehydrogenase family)